MEKWHFLLAGVGTRKRRGSPVRNAARIVVAAIGLAAAHVAVAEGDLSYPTRLSPDGTLTIVRRPPAADFARGRLKAIPKYDPDDSKNPFPVDLRSCDLSEISAKGHEGDLAFATFDSRTKWPTDLKTAPDFEPDKVMELGKDPGLAVRSLHEKGITGNGVGIAIIDQGLLVDHEEYRERLQMYEEIHCGDVSAQMHGPAVASIAVGKTIGVAPEADLYYIAETHGTWGSGKGFGWDFRFLGQSIDRILDLNKKLPLAERIRVISISVGWSPQQQGYKEVMAAVRRAKDAGVFVVSCSLSETYEGMSFHGLGRDPLKDPNEPGSYAPGRWWAQSFFENYEAYRQRAPKGTLFVPMDARTTASPTGRHDYVFYRSGGWSWSVPYIAGLYTLACQVKPDVEPEQFWAAAIATGRSNRIEANGKLYTLDKIVDPTRLIERLQRARATDWGSEPADSETRTR